MATEGPARILVDADGNILSVEDGAAIGDAEALVVAGVDGSTARFLRVDEDGQITSKIAGPHGHEIDTYHAGRVTAIGAVHGTHALFTHDQDAHRFLNRIAGALERIETMIADVAEEDSPGHEEDEDL